MSENDDMMYALYNEELLQKQWLEERGDCELIKLRRWDDPFPYGVLYRTEFAEERKWYKSEDRRDQEFKKLAKERDRA